MHSSIPANAVLVSDPRRAMATIQAEIDALIEPCPLCDLSDVGPCPACDGKGWVSLESPAVR